MSLISVATISMNEEQAVAKVITEIREVLKGRAHEIVIVDSSRDRTPEIAEEMGARVIRQFPPRGYGRAMDRVLRESRGDVIVTLDCDGTYPVAQIPMIADRVVSGACDLVNASRLGKRPDAMPFANYLANAVFALTARILLGPKFTDLHSGMRAYSRKMMQQVEFDPDGPALPVELLLKPALLGFRVEEVFIPYLERIGSTTLQRWSSTLWTFRRILRLLRLRIKQSERGGANSGAIART